MFHIYHNPHDGQLTVTKIQAGHPAGTLTLANVHELLLLRKRINDYIDTLQADGEVSELPPASVPQLISTEAALTIAEEKGKELPPTTLRSAIVRGQIPGEKRGGRWFVDRTGFESWMQRWPRR